MSIVISLKFDRNYYWTYQSSYHEDNADCINYANILVQLKLALPDFMKYCNCQNISQMRIDACLSVVHSVVHSLERAVYRTDIDTYASLYSTSILYIQPLIPIDSIYRSLITRTTNTWRIRNSINELTEFLNWQYVGALFKFYLGNILHIEKLKAMMIEKELLHYSQL